MKTVMDTSSWGKKHQKLIAQEIAKREKKWETECSEPMKAISLELKKLKTENSEKFLKTEELKNNLVHKCARLRGQFQREVEKLNEDYAGKILTKVKNISSQLAVEKKLNIVFSLFRGVVLFADDTVDITEKVIMRLDSGE
ncbi:MAG: OmpH family outer membrane protein [Deltaproteobacteria bacterium]|nr:OmpH family outer membrane protein [Deltaproteobacteria bacterium]